MKPKREQPRVIQTILLAEDDSNEVWLIQRAFNKNGIKDHLQVVENGAAAIEYLSGKGKFADREAFPLPDLVITDLRMPLMGGLDLLKWMHANREVSRIPAVLLTSSISEQDQAIAYRFGVCGYYIKPHTLDELILLVRHIYEYWTKNPALMSLPIQLSTAPSAA